jgi:hypothetical protein
MKTVKTSHLESLANVKIRVSRASGRLSNWKHTEHETLPQLSYDFEETDKRFAGKDDELHKLAKIFWNLENKDGKTQQQQYEYDLKTGLSSLLEKLNSKFNKELGKAIDKEFK